MNNNNNNINSSVIVDDKGNNVLILNIPGLSTPVKINLGKVNIKRSSITTETIEQPVYRMNEQDNDLDDDSDDDDHYDDLYDNLDDDHIRTEY